MSNKDQKKIQDLQAESRSLLHSMQSAVAFGLAGGDGDREHKHLRVGINNSLVSHTALVKLLLSKGVITELEYWESYVAQLREEIDGYRSEAELTLPGSKINFI